MTIYVDHMAFNATNSTLRQRCELSGTVEESRVITDRETGRSKGFGFVEMADSIAAKAAMAKL